jgi:hypothetical protein
VRSTIRQCVADLTFNDAAISNHRLRMSSGTDSLLFDIRLPLSGSGTTLISASTFERSVRFGRTQRPARPQLVADCDSRNEPVFRGQEVDHTDIGWSGSPCG